MEALSTMNYLSLVFAIPFAVLLPLYIKAENQGGFKKPTTLKVLLSGLCALCALTGYILWGKHIDASRVLIVCALASAILGDYYLQFIQLDEKKYTRGLEFFSLTQFFFIVFLCALHGVAWPEIVITTAIAASALVIIKQQKWQLGDSKGPLMVYLFLLVFMTCKAVLAVFGDGGASVSNSLFAAGAVCFIVSDVLLGFNNYQTKNSFGSLHLVAYFCALLLIALSVSF